MELACEGYSTWWHRWRTRMLVVASFDPGRAKLPVVGVCKCGYGV